MAIMVNIYYTGINGNAVKFAKEMTESGIVSQIRAEDGNLRYDYCYLLDDCETVLLIDSWVDQHALDVHHASPMMQKIIELREKYNLSMRVERYLLDESGVPEKDKAFIRY
ncbi:MAG: antibiotic biosynthesis monooxygenase [Clostridia bacterium]|nr:antibiotic biosynthesis monooxygenase [Clostridia bacterium]